MTRFMYLYMFLLSLCLTAELCVCECVTEEQSSWKTTKFFICLSLFAYIADALCQKPRGELSGVLVKGELFNRDEFCFQHEEVLSQTVNITYSHTL